MINKCINKIIAFYTTLYVFISEYVYLKLMYLVGFTCYSHNYMLYNSDDTILSLHFHWE